MRKGVNTTGRAEPEPLIAVRPIADRGKRSAEELTVDLQIVHSKSGSTETVCFFPDLAV